MMTVPRKLTSDYGILGIGYCKTFKEYDGTYRIRLNYNPHCYNNLFACCKKHLSFNEYKPLITDQTVRTTL